MVVFTAIFIALAVLVIGIVMITSTADIEETIPYSCPFH